MNSSLNYFHYDQFQMISKILKIFKKPPPMSPFIKVGDHESVGIVTIDRQKALNAINGDMFR